MSMLRGWDCRACLRRRRRRRTRDAYGRRRRGSPPRGGRGGPGSSLLLLRCGSIGNGGRAGRCLLLFCGVCVFSCVGSRQEVGKTRHETTVNKRVSCLFPATWKNGKVGLLRREEDKRHRNRPKACLDVHQNKAPGIRSRPGSAREGRPQKSPEIPLSIHNSL